MHALALLRARALWYLLDVDEAIAVSCVVFLACGCCCDTSVCSNWRLLNGKNEGPASLPCSPCSVPSVRVRHSKKEGSPLGQLGGASCSFVPRGTAYQSGNLHFKRRNFAAAATAYTAALSACQAKNRKLMSILYANRAAARLAESRYG